MCPISCPVILVVTDVVVLWIEDEASALDQTISLTGMGWSDALSPGGVLYCTWSCSVETK